MNNTNLKEILKEYEQKRLSVEMELAQKKQAIYLSNPLLKKVEDELNSYAFSTVKSILSKPSENYLSDLEKRINDLKIEKQNIINSLNLDYDLSTPNYECKICNDTGFIQGDNSSILCNCIKQKLFNIEYNKSNIGNLEKENFEKFNLNIYSDEINIEKYNSNISPRENIKNIKSICENFIKNFDNADEKNLLFTGNTGLGKTYLSNCIAKELLSKGKTVLYQTSSVMLDNIIDFKFGKSPSKDIYNSILDVDLLIIDDLGTESINNIKFSELFNIINNRLLNQHNHITKTIISTNLSLKNLFAVYDERIVSRFVGYYNICKFFGDDIRFKKGSN